MKNKLAVIAVGGNAIAPDANHLNSDKQYEKVLETTEHIAQMMLEGWNVVVTHGNGPQVGMELRRAELAANELPSISMDYAGANTQGALGYMFVRAFQHTFKKYNIQRQPVAIITQTLVDIHDPAFIYPTKPIGSWFTEEKARKLTHENNWKIIEDSGRGWRRVVPSPQPKAIIEKDIILNMVNLGFTVITLGGGGIPVIKDDNGLLVGVEAVIDKDMSSALLAEQLNADMLILPTAVEKVAVHFGKPTQQWLDKLTISQAEKYLAEGEFPAGSMGPKIQALVNYVKTTKGTGLITTPQSMKAAIKGTNGTHIING